MWMRHISCLCTHVCACMNRDEELSWAPHAPHAHTPAHALQAFCNANDCCALCHVLSFYDCIFNALGSISGLARNLMISSSTSSSLLTDRVNRTCTNIYGVLLIKYSTRSPLEWVACITDAAESVMFEPQQRFGSHESMMQHHLSNRAVRGIRSLCLRKMQACKRYSCIRR